VKIIGIGISDTFQLQFIGFI